MAPVHWAFGCAGSQPPGSLMWLMTKIVYSITSPASAVGPDGDLEMVSSRRLALQPGGICCALAGAASNSGRARMAAVAVTTFPIQVLIEVLRFVFVRFWAEVWVCPTFSNLLSECPRSPLLERCGSRLILTSAED